MQRIASRSVWVRLPRSAQADVVKEVLRILTEEVENERFHDSSSTV